MVWRALLFTVFEALLVAFAPVAHASPVPRGRDEAQRWLLRNDWDQDASLAFPAGECPSRETKQRSVEVAGTRDVITLKIKGVGDYRCNVAMSISDAHKVLLYRSSYWFGYELGPERGTSHTLSVGLFVLDARPILGITEGFGPAMGSCASCGSTTAATFLVLRRSQSPSVRKIRSIGDAPLSYAVHHSTIQIHAGMSLECHACVYETTTPYRLNPQTLTLEKSGNTILDTPRRTDEVVPTEVVNYHLLTRPVWGPWALSSAGGTCALTASSRSGMQVSFGLAGSSLGLLMGQTLPDDAAPWRTEEPTASRVTALEHDDALPSRITAFVDGVDQIDFSAGRLLPNGFMLARAAPTLANSQPLAGTRNVAALAGHFLVLDLMWGTNEWGLGATYRRLIGMDISGGRNAVTQLMYCSGRG